LSPPLIQTDTKDTFTPSSQAPTFIEKMPKYADISSLKLPKSISTYDDITYLDPKSIDQLKDLNTIT
jgi:hypothetical protein